MKFLHTADWQLGKPYGRIEDSDKRSQARLQRIRVIEKLADVAREKEAEFVVVAGDLFDSSSVNRSTVSSACAAIGKIPVPVYVIPGNHDHGGPGGVWEQDFYKREAQALAPNLRVLLEARPVELEGAVLLPCPLLRRSETVDTTTWLRDAALLEGLGEKPRIVIAHGATVDFGGARDADEQGYASNHVDLGRLPMEDLDYVALGDWHGTKEVSPKAWYSGTPEPDRFPRGEGYDSGNVLLVNVERGASPVVEPIAVGGFRWQELAFHLNGDADIGALDQSLKDMVGARTNRDFLRLTLSGSVGISGRQAVDDLLETLASRLLRLKVTDQLQLAPSQQELQELTTLPHPIIKRVAGQLLQLSQSADVSESRNARSALLELFTALPKDESLS